MNSIAKTSNSVGDLNIPPSVATLFDVPILISINSSSTESEKLFTQISSLVNLSLKKDIGITLEPDSDGYIARSEDFPLFGYGDFPFEAIENIKHDIESLYYDLQADDNLTQEWQRYKDLFSEIIDG
jgi:hypothetical protein